MLFGRVRVKINLRHCKRNIYIILAYVKRALVEANKEKKYNKLWNEVMKTTKYEDALKVIRKYVKIIDTSKA